MKIQEYECDSCHRRIKDPYLAKMKEFDCGDYYHNEQGVLRRKMIIRKGRIHLCDKCFKGLCDLSEKI